MDDGAKEIGIFIQFAIFYTTILETKISEMQGGEAFLKRNG
jgi:hypothetical protein